MRGGRRLIWPTNQKDEMPSSSEIDRKIGSRLRERREAIGISLEELAAVSGLAVAEVLQYECGAKGLTAAQLCHLADLLEAPLTYFHRPTFTHLGLSTSLTSGDLLEVFGRLSPAGRQKVAALALELERAQGRHTPGI